MNRRLIEEGTRLILQGLEVDTEDHNFTQTPRRVADVYEEMFCPPDTGYPVFSEDYADIILIKGHVFYTMCPHHLLPVKIKAAIAYKPKGQVIGASKLMRMMHDANRYPMTQEKLTQVIQAKVYDLTMRTSEGEAILLQGNHGCFEMRGVHSASTMVTVRYRGVFETEAELRQRFEMLVRMP